MLKTPQYCENFKNSINQFNNPKNHHENIKHKANHNFKRHLAIDTLSNETQMDRSSEKIDNCLPTVE